MAPIPRRNERAGPQTCLLCARGFFFANIDIRVAPECERPAAGYHRGVDVRLADKAGHDAPVIAVALITRTGNGATVNQPDQRLARCDPASVGVLSLIKADLVGLWRIDAVQTDPRVLYGYGISIGNSRDTCYCRGRGSNSRTCKQ